MTEQPIKILIPLSIGGTKKMLNICENHSRIRKYLLFWTSIHFDSSHINNPIV